MYSENLLYYYKIYFKRRLTGMKKLFSMFFLLFFLAGCSEEVDSTETFETQSKMDQSIGYSVMENFGYRHEFPEDAVKLIEFNDETKKLTIIAFTYVFLDETYDEFRVDTLDSCANVLQDVKRHSEVLEVDLIIETKIETPPGDPVDYAVFNMVFKRNNLKRVNFNELDSLLLNKKANFYLEAPFEVSHDRP